MTNPMTDEAAIEILRSAISSLNCPVDTEALDHIIDRLAQPAEAVPVAWMIQSITGVHRARELTLHWPDAEWRTQYGDIVTPLYTAPQPPAIPEPTDEDVGVAAIALCPPDGWNDFVSPVKRRWERYVVEAYTALTADRARLRAKLSLGERNDR